MYQYGIPQLHCSDNHNHNSWFYLYRTVDCFHFFQNQWQRTCGASTCSRICPVYHFILRLIIFLTVSIGPSPDPDYIPRTAAQLPHMQTARKNPWDFVKHLFFSMTLFVLPSFPSQVKCPSGQKTNYSRIPCIVNNGFLLLSHILSSSHNLRHTDRHWVCVQLAWYSSCYFKTNLDPVIYSSG